MDTASELNKIEFPAGTDEHYRIAYKYFMHLLKERVRKDGMQFVFDEQCRQPIAIFIAWAAKLEEHLQRLTDGKATCKKGILLRGNVGSGKTVLFRTLRDIKMGTDYEMSGLFRGIILDKCEKIAKIYQAGGDKAIEEFTKGVIRSTDNRSGKSFRNYCFDDLGDEEVKNHYGNSREVMKDIINDRYEQFVDDGLISCFTTNLTMDEIEKRYDRRTRSRLEQMCNIIGMGTTENYIDRRRSA
jgi:hypothetical protein